VRTHYRHHRDGLRLWVSGSGLPLTG